jgi:hypothetical protein
MKRVRPLEPYPLDKEHLCYHCDKIIAIDEEAYRCNCGSMFHAASICAKGVSSMNMACENCDRYAIQRGFKKPLKIKISNMVSGIQVCKHPHRTINVVKTRGVRTLMDLCMIQTIYALFHMDKGPEYNTLLRDIPDVLSRRIENVLKRLDEE